MMYMFEFVCGYLDVVVCVNECLSFCLYLCRFMYVLVCLYDNLGKHVYPSKHLFKITYSNTKITHPRKYIKKNLVRELKKIYIK